jgi:hypothetical protein
VTLETVDKQNVKHVYHSLNEVPPEFRAAFEKMQTEPDVEKVLSSAFSKKETLPSGTTSYEKTAVFKLKDGAGKEQVYHSLDEMPPETRALFEKIQGRLE